MAKTFEYRVEIDASPIDLGIINKLGAEGWELVAVESVGESSVYWFKREKATGVGWI